MTATASASDATWSLCAAVFGQAMTSVTINGHRLNWSAEHYVGFWDKVERGDWEPQTFAVIDHFVTQETTVVDFGANIGVITIYAARKAKRVICFEPDPISREALLVNIEANPEIAQKVTVVPKAIHPSGRPIRFGSQGKGGDSLSSAVLPDLQTVWTVDTITPSEVASLLPDEDEPVFVKMDIEGGEYEILPASMDLWRRPNLALLLSTHQNLLSRFQRRSEIRSLTRRAFAALRDYDVREVRRSGLKRRAWLSFLHRMGLASPRRGYDWLFSHVDEWK